MKANLNHATKKYSNPILTGLIYTFSIVILSTVVLTLILYFTSLSEQSLPIFIYITTAISLLIGGFKSGKIAGTRGWYYGGITGIIYGIILSLIWFLGFNLDFQLRLLALLLLSFLFGSFGGMVGVNSKR
ncbi:TIGR04086 family membrane protein [Tepidibacillus fermentans]|uniref:Putative membrane protein (TIGR04086 family) n=1 Tax=Tepidibacillus fermentans TaxID=1281767 RepID=A0A4R3KJI7_9BACI|nr:TIGR04086 family membrane protein [Tepidibacillus fermentans]TCS83838.1 putative membrane protein (TIGR04086 family) [Tepidibacillus fermentans]